MDTQEERLRIAKTAAVILREDTRQVVYTTDEYIPADTALEIMISRVPETLNIFMKTFINKRKKVAEDDKRRRCVVINDAVISATRPHSFLVVIQVGLSTYIHRHLWSRHRVD